MFRDSLQCTVQQRYFFILGFVLFDQILGYTIKCKKKKGINNYFQNNASLDLEKLNHFVYVDSVVKESLRISPTIPIVDRLTTTDVEIDSTNIPQETCVHANLYALCHDSKIYPNPDQFFPERWYLQEDMMKTRYSFFVPFGTGERRCLAQRFVIDKLVIAAILILKNFDVSFDHKQTNVVPTLNCGALIPKDFEPIFST